MLAVHFNSFTVYVINSVAGTNDALHHKCSCSHYTLLYYILMIAGAQTDTRIDNVTVNKHENYSHPHPRPKRETISCSKTEIVHVVVALIIKAPRCPF